MREEYRKETEGPHIVAAGPPITRTGGHCWYLGGQADGEKGVIAAVIERDRNGADLVKIMATGGMSTIGSDPGGSQYTAAELGAAVRAAHRLGPPVTGHAHGAAGIADAVAAGCGVLTYDASYCTAQRRPSTGCPPGASLSSEARYSGRVVGVLQQAACRPSPARPCVLSQRPHSRAAVSSSPRPR
ncbi:amidohydrolase family protein [Streptomyces humicola]|uniref:amidohydrolase family protein n=1 Tax=Streptomyces humicola TaxID=2953240 RepID=UPI003555C611